jgi:hypothetical protein
MAKKREPPKLFWLTYRHSDGSAARVVVIESRDILHARLKASLAGADRELSFASGHQLDRSVPIPANMIGKFLDDGPALMPTVKAIRSASLSVSLQWGSK